VEGAFAPDVVRSTLVAVVVDGQWQVGIGDPDPMGWFITASYCIVSVLCAWAAVRTLCARRGGAARELPVFWLIAALFAFVLGVNKQLDLQMWLFITGKQLAKAQGWYEYRRTVENISAIAGAAAGICSLLVLCWHARDAMRQHCLALVGMTFTLCFILIRACSLLHVNVVLRWETALIKANWAIELVGLACLGASAVQAISRARTERPETEALP